MDNQYDTYYDHVLSLHDHFKDNVDGRYQPQAVSLQKELHELSEDFKRRRHPRSIEDRVRTIEHQLLQIRAQGKDVMSYQEVDDLQQKCQELRRNIQRMPGY